MPASSLIRRAVVAVTLLLACSRTQTADDTMTAAPITIRTDRISYRAADPVRLTVVNASDRSYTFNPCARVLEREQDGAWAEVREERICTMMAHLLDARATVTEETDLGDGLPPGRYRIVVHFTADDAVTSDASSIRAASAPLTVDR